MPLNPAKHIEGMKGFDVDLKFGKHFEHLMDDIFSGVYKAEVKTERDQWVKYGNLAIELSCNNKASGLSRTEADIWLHNLSVKGELIASILVPVDVFREVVHKMVEDKVARVTKGGDGWRSELALIPIKTVMEYIHDYAKEL